MSAYQTISNRTAQKTFTTHNYAYFNDVFTKDELEKIIELNSKISLRDGNTIERNLDSFRISKITHQYLNEDNQWIFDRINQLIVHANLDFFEYDLVGYDFYQYAEYHMENAGHYDYHVDIILMAVI